MNQNKHALALVETLQVRATARAGIFISMSTDQGAELYAPLTATEARKLGQDLTTAADAYEAHEAKDNAPA